MSTIEKVENHSPISPQIPNELFQLARATRGQANPLVTAMCYPHCPQIARLYLDGVQPTNVYDPIVHGLTDYLTGKTFRQVMEEYGLPQLLPAIRSYYKFIMNCRSVGEPLSMETELALQYRSEQNAESIFGMGKQLEKFGGSWVNLQSYLRSWSVLMETWKAQMKIPEDDSVKREFCKFEVLTSIALNQKKWQLLVPVWGWKVTKGADKRIYLGLLTTRSQGLDALRSVQSVYRCTRNSKYAARRLKRYDDLFVLRIPDVMFWRKKSPVQICRKKSIGRRFDKGLDLQK